MVEKRTRKKKEKEKTDHQIIVEILQKMVKPQILADKTIWPREYKIAKELFNTYPDFYRIFINISFTVNSLAFFKTIKGKSEIEKIIYSINYVTKNNNEVVELSKEKIGEDLHIEKPMSLREFLNKYK